MMVMDEFSFSMSKIVLKKLQPMFLCLYIISYSWPLLPTNTLTQPSWCNSVIESALQRGSSSLFCSPWWMAVCARVSSLIYGNRSFSRHCVFDLQVRSLCRILYVCWVIQAKRAEQRKHKNTHLSSHSPHEL